MKTSIKFLAAVITTAIISFSMSTATFAQHRGGGGGGFHAGGSGGGGFHGGNGLSGGGFHGGGSFQNGGSFNGNHGSFQGQRQSPGRVQSQQFNNSPRYNSAPQRSYGGSVRISGQSYVSRGQRGYVGSARIYGRGGYGGGYFRGGYHYNRGYYSRFYAPRLGLRINVLPYGYYPFFWGDDQFYYDNGLFYQQYDNTQYEVVAPPMGAIVPSVPQNAKTITIDGVDYYELNGIYYQPVTADDGTTAYKIVGKDGELNTDQNNGDTPQDDNNNTNN